MGAAIAAAVIAAGGAAYAANQSSKASKEASAAMQNGAQPLQLDRLPFPETVDWQEALRSAIGSNFQNLPMNFALGNQVNKFNLNQFQRGVGEIQPYLRQNQELIGRNAASFARGELPSDVVNSIGRAAAQRGLQGGFAGGLNAGGPGGALAGLNLRNLGLASLDLSRTGTQMAQSANASAASMLPGLYDPSSMFVTPGMALGAEGNNANIINRWNELNAGYQHDEALQNTSLQNSLLESAVGAQYQQKLAQAQAVQSAASSVAGIAGSGAFGGLGGGYGNSFGATQAAAPNNRVTYTPGVGYAAVPNII